MSKIRLIIIAAAIMAGATATSTLGGGQVSVIEWDSRSPEQIAASVPADTVVFQKQGEAKGGNIVTRAFAEWKALFDMISGLRVRIRLVNIQWGSDK